MRDCVERLNSLDIVDELRRCLVTNHSLYVWENKYCLTTRKREESGLGFLPGKVKRFNTKNSVKVPHMGWNTVASRETTLFLWNFKK